MNRRACFLISSLIMIIINPGILASDTNQGSASSPRTGTAIIAVNDFTLSGATSIPHAHVGHVAVLFENPNTHLYEFVSVQASDQNEFVTPEVKYRLTKEDAQNILRERGYTRFKTIEVKDPQFENADAEISNLELEKFELGASTPLGLPSRILLTSESLNPFDLASKYENCLTGGIKILEKYGAEMPGIEPLKFTTPKAYYESLSGEEEYTLSSTEYVAVTEKASSPGATLTPKNNEKTFTQPEEKEPAPPSASQSTAEEPDVPAAVVALKVATQPDLQAKLQDVTPAQDLHPVLQQAPQKNGEETHLPVAVAAVQIGSLQDSQVSKDQPNDIKFEIGNKVETTNALNVRSAPGTSTSTVIGTKTTGSTGTVLDGPISADGFTWWKIKYDDGTTGWSEDKRLELAPTNPQDEPEPAYQPVPDEQVTLTLYVHNGSASGSVIPGARVKGQDGSGNSFEETANSDGYVTIGGTPGTWSFSAMAFGYQINNWDQEISKTCTKHAYLQCVETQMSSPASVDSATQDSENSVVGKWKYSLYCDACGNLGEAGTVTGTISFNDDGTASSDGETYYWEQHGSNIRWQHDPEYMGEDGKSFRCWFTNEGTITMDTMKGTAVCRGLPGGRPEDLIGSWSAERISTGESGN